MAVNRPPAAAASGAPSVVGGRGGCALLLAALVATSAVVVDAYPGGVGSCAAGFAKFPDESEHNYYGGLEDNWGDLAMYGLTVTLDGGGTGSGAAAASSSSLAKPPGASTFHYAGTCGSTTELGLCGKCQGACYNGDEDCKDGLKCMIRDGSENEEDADVPGCSVASGGEGYWDGTNYCYDPADGARRELLLLQPSQKLGRGADDNDNERESERGRELERDLQGQRSEINPNIATLNAGETYRLTLQAPFDDATDDPADPDKYFKGFLFRLEGTGNAVNADYLDLGSTLRVVDESSSKSDAQILASTEEVAGVGLPDYQASCASHVSAACHTESSKKVSATVELVVPDGVKDGFANLEVTAMVGEHQWYLTSYILKVVEAPPAPVPNPTPAPTAAPVEAAQKATEDPPPPQDPQDDGDDGDDPADTTTGGGGDDKDTGRPTDNGDIDSADPDSAEDGDGDDADLENDTVDTCSLGVVCAKLMSAPTLDGDLTDWSADVAKPVSAPLTSAMAVIPYRHGEMTIMCAFDDTHLHLAVTVPGKYNGPAVPAVAVAAAANGNGNGGNSAGEMSAAQAEFRRKRAAPAISAMLKVGPDATLYHMGGCLACNPTEAIPPECYPRAVDVGGHLELGANGRDEMGTEYALARSPGHVSSYCSLKNEEEVLSSSQEESEWSAAWSYSAASSSSSPAVDAAAPQFEARNDDANAAPGMFTFELSRTLATSADSDLSAQLSEGNTYSFGMAFWDPADDANNGGGGGWKKADHYVTGCSREWMGLIIGEQPQQDDGVDGGNGTSAAGDDGGAGDSVLGVKSGAAAGGSRSTAAATGALLLSGGIAAAAWLAAV